MTAHVVLMPEHLLPRVEADFVAAAAAVGDTVRLVPITIEGEIVGDGTGAEALFRYFPFDRTTRTLFSADHLARLIASVPDLRWIQTNSSGVDYLLKMPALSEECIITTGSSVNSGPMAESVMAMLLGVARKLPEHVRDQERHEWGRYRKQELRGSTVVIVGYGHIGREVARLCDAFGMRIVVVRKHAATETPYAAAVFGIEELATAVAGADFVVLVAPTQPGAPPLVDAAILAAMPRTAWLINVGRGALVDDDALLAALGAGEIAGAALDVFVQEPLPADHPYWDAPNVVITPHNAAATPHQDARTIALFTENFRRWVGGEPLLNQIDRRRGY